MSVAYDLFPEALELSRGLHDYARPAAAAAAARPGGRPRRRAARPPARAAPMWWCSHAPRSVAPPLRLTRRGVVVLALAVPALAVALVWAAAASAPVAGVGLRRVRGPAAASVTVRPGDTLWSIATRVAPARTRGPRSTCCATPTTSPASRWCPGRCSRCTERRRATSAARPVGTRVDAPRGALAEHRVRRSTVHPYM